LPKNDEGEFELILGNRQLISVFLIVVVLLGVFFSMGYIVGRNSSPGTADIARNEKPKPDRPADSANPDADAPLDSSTTPSAPPSAPAANDTTPPEITKPAQSAPAPVKSEPPRVREVKPKPSPSPAPAVAPARPPVHAAAAGEPSGGQYWQVVATSRPDAEIIAEALGKKGFHSVLAPAPKDGIFRVLVGPLPDAATEAQTRTGLESAGFKNPILRKY
jgi:cell division septation protein DedD